MGRTDALQATWLVVQEPALDGLPLGQSSFSYDTPVTLAGKSASRGEWGPYTIPSKRNITKRSSSLETIVHLRIDFTTEIPSSDRRMRKEFWKRKTFTASNCRCTINIYEGQSSTCPTFFLPYTKYSQNPPSAGDSHMFGLETSFEFG